MSVSGCYLCVCYDMAFMHYCFIALFGMRGTYSFALLTFVEASGEVHQSSLISNPSIVDQFLRHS
jgi:hypothetical protein